MKVLGFADKTSASTKCNKTLQHFGDQSRGWGGKGRIDKVWNRVSHGLELSASMDEQGLYVFPTHRLKWEQNKAKLLQCNTQPYQCTMGQQVQWWTLSTKMVDDPAPASNVVFMWFAVYTGPFYINEDPITCANWTCQ